MCRGLTTCNIERYPASLKCSDLLAQGRVDTLPLKLLAVKREPIDKARPKTRKAGATIELGWGRKAFRFAVECQAVSTPKEIAAAAETAKREQQPAAILPDGTCPVTCPSPSYDSCRSSRSVASISPATP